MDLPEPLPPRRQNISFSYTFSSSPRSTSSCSREYLKYTPENSRATFLLCTYSSGGSARTELLKLCSIRSRPSLTVSGHSQSAPSLEYSLVAAGNAPAREGIFFIFPTALRVSPYSATRPPSSASTRFATGSTSSRQCDIIMTVSDSSRLSRATAFIKSPAAIGSRRAVGSSSKSSSGCMTITEARERSCF